jgi:hypothetical protein
VVDEEEMRSMMREWERSDGARGDEGQWERVHEVVEIDWHCATS